MRGQWQIVLAYLFAQHFAFIRSFVQHLMMLPKSIAGEAGKIGLEPIAPTLFALERVVAVMLVRVVFAPE